MSVKTIMLDVEVPSAEKLEALRDDLRARYLAIADCVDQIGLRPDAGYDDPFKKIQRQLFLLKSHEINLIGSEAQRLSELFRQRGLDVFLQAKGGDV